MENNNNITPSERARLWRKEVKSKGFQHYTTMAPEELVKLLKQVAREWKANHPEFYTYKG